MISRARMTNHIILDVARSLFVIVVLVGLGALVALGLVATPDDKVQGDAVRNLTHLVAALQGTPAAAAHLHEQGVEAASLRGGDHLLNGVRRGQRGAGHPKCTRLLGSGRLVGPGHQHGDGAHEEHGGAEPQHRNHPFYRGIS